ncbi:hypothetical protein PoB_002421300 [Plakobranchus ocellatus]|uniref:Uncharacterized protein n=1 Tax=Plakobranchus ocellatus TaxID=259542 RepID=A0AAV3ZTA0_9GAST|nr:hypothetical protein PoB_002421300 [Plakobranchus ocellatus]
MRCFHKLLNISYKDHITSEKDKGHPTSDRAVHRPLNFCETAGTKMIRPHHPFPRSCQNHSTRFCTGWRKKRQTNNNLEEQKQ